MKQLVKNNSVVEFFSHCIEDNKKNKTAKVAEALYNRVYKTRGDVTFEVIVGICKLANLEVKADFCFSGACGHCGHVDDIYISTDAGMVSFSSDGTVYVDTFGDIAEAGE